MTFAPYSSDDMNVGFEDIDPTDMTIPRLRIDGKSAEFVDSLSGQRYGSLKAVFLGLVKQRIMWDDDVQDDEKPLCKSPDFENGFPNVNPKTPVDKQFPWHTSNFQKPADLSVQPMLNCASCVFATWDKTKWKNGIPPCSEQHTYVIIYEDESGAMVPALFTTQRSGMKSSKAYVSSFMRSKVPMFTVWTTLTLDPQKRGSVEYAVPVYSRGGPTDENNWGEYAQTYRGVRDMIRQPPRSSQEDTGTSSSTAASTVASTVVETPQVAQVAPEPEVQQATQAAPEPEPAPTVAQQVTQQTTQPVAPPDNSSDDDDSDLPF